MAHVGTPLDAGERFPAMSLALVAGGAFDPLAAARGGWCILLVYRGHW